MALKPATETPPDQFQPGRHQLPRIAPSWVENSYYETVANISQYADDLIFFSWLLCQDLMTQGNALRDEYLRQFREPPPTVARIEYTPETIALIPAREGYQDWFDKFQNEPREPKQSFFSFHWGQRARSMEP